MYIFICQTGKLSNVTIKPYQIYFFKRSIHLHSSVGTFLQWFSLPPLWPPKPGELGSDGPFPVFWPQGHGCRSYPVIWRGPRSWVLPIYFPNKWGTQEPQHPWKSQVELDVKLVIFVGWVMATIMSCLVCFGVFVSPLVVWHCDAG